LNEKKPSSDQIRKATVQDYLTAQSHADGHGIKGFFKSNLFSALVLFVLGQGVIFAGTVIAMYWRVSAIIEWKGKVEGRLERMDEQGTIYSHYHIEELDKSESKHDARLERIEDDSRQFEVLKSEHRRLTNDVEQLKNGKK